MLYDDGVKFRSQPITIVVRIIYCLLLVNCTARGAPEYFLEWDITPQLEIASCDVGHPFDATVHLLTRRCIPKDHLTLPGVCAEDDAPCDLQEPGYLNSPFFAKLV